MSKVFLTGYLFGHRIFYDHHYGGWVYEDSGELVDTAEPRTCPQCGLMPTEDGHDPCIANLPGVIYACCGHGVCTGYLTFTDGRTIRFEQMVRDDNKDPRFPRISRPAVPHEPR